METKQRAAATDRCATPRNIPPRGLPRLVVEVCQRGDRGAELRDMARHGFVSRGEGNPSLVAWLVCLPSPTGREVVSEAIRGQRIYISLYVCVHAYNSIKSKKRVAQERQSVLTTFVTVQISYFVQHYEVSERTFKKKEAQISSHRANNV